MMPDYGNCSERTLPRIYLHFMAFTALLGGFVFALVVLNNWNHLRQAPGLFFVAWFPSACVELFRRLEVERLVWPSMMLSSILGYRLAN